MSGTSAEPAPPRPPSGFLRWKHPASISRTRNVLWNLPATIVQALVPFVFVPVYIRLLGPEAYALVVLNTTLLSALIFLDGLVSPVVVREFGRLNGEPGGAAPMRDALCSLEWLAVALAAVAGLAVAVAAVVVLGGWSASPSRAAAILPAALAMAAAVAAQWPGFLYGAGLLGLQRQSVASTAKLATAIASYGGGALLLWLARADVLLLFIWQAMVFAVSGLALRAVLWRLMPPGRSATRPSLPFLGGVWRFALGSLLTGLAASTMLQIDKLMVAKVATPGIFAAYGLSFIVASAASGVVTGPLVSAMQPHFAALVGRGDAAATADAYRRWAQIFALAAAPAMGGLAALSGPLVDLWLGSSPEIGPIVKDILPLTAAAMLLVALLGPPTVLQLAAGRTGLILASHVGNIVVALVALPPLLRSHGAGAAAWLNIGLMASYYVVMAPIALGRLLPAAYARWLWADVLLPLAVTAAAFALTRQAAALVPGPLAAAAFGCLGAVLVFGVLFICLPHGRRQLVQSSRFLLGRRTDVAAAPLDGRNVTNSSR